MERDRPGDITDREVTVQLEVRSTRVTDRGAPERDDRPLLHVEEIVALEMLVPLLRAGLDAGGLDLDLGVRLLGIVRAVDPAGVFREPATNLGEDVARDELHCRV